MSKEALKSWREKHRLLGLCRECKNPAMPGHTRCERHLVFHADSDINRRRKRQRKGLCPKCGQPAEPNFRHCKKHLQHFREIKNNRLANGRCRRCGPLLHPEMDEGFVNCIFCRERIPGHGDQRIRYRGKIYGYPQA